MKPISRGIRAVRRLLSRKRYGLRSKSAQPGQCGCYYMTEDRFIRTFRLQEDAVDYLSTFKPDGIIFFIDIVEVSDQDYLRELVYQARLQARDTGRITATKGEWN